MADKNNNIDQLITPELADQMLQNIFEACDFEPNTIKLEDLETYSNYRSDRFAIRKILVIAMLVLFFLVPVLFISPHITSVNQTTDASPTYNISVDSLLPVTSVRATINGKDAPVYETQKHVYTIQPGEEGTMYVTVTILNHQYVQKKIKVTDVDSASPSVVNSRKDSDRLYLYVEDEISGIDYDTVYAMGSDKRKIDPMSIDENEGLIIFRYPTASLNIYIPDKAGNQLQLLLTV